RTGSGCADRARIRIGPGRSLLGGLLGRGGGLLLLAAALLFLPLAGRNQDLVGLVLHAAASLLKAVHDFANALAVFRQIAVKAGKLRVGAEPDHVEHSEREG